MAMVFRAILAWFLAVGFAAGSPAFAHAGGAGGAGSGAGQSGAGSAGGGAAAAIRDEQMSSKQPTSCGAGSAIKDDACIKANSQLLSDSELYQQGRALALAGHYVEALQLLAAVRLSSSPMVYTMRGFALRKLGHFDEAIEMYDRALALEPRNVDAHEYLGEGYVTRGRADLARVELAAVKAGCGGVACEQYRDLARAIETGVVE